MFYGKTQDTINAYGKITVKLLTIVPGRAITTVKNVNACNGNVKGGEESAMGVQKASRGKKPRRDRADGHLPLSAGGRRTSKKYLFSGDQHPSGADDVESAN